MVEEYSFERTFDNAPMLRSAAKRSMPMIPQMAPMMAGQSAPTMAFGGVPTAQMQGGMAYQSRFSNAAPPMLGARMNINNMKKLDELKAKVKKEGAMFYEEIEKTTIWSETGNWKSSINETTSIEMNLFWKDVFENINTQGKVLSKNFINILNNSFTELIFACALMDLPLTSKDNQEVTLNSQTYKINTKSNIIILYKQLMVSWKKKKK